MTETELLLEIQVHASRAGMRLFRNNCGALQDATGRWVRYGIANPGGADLIGWTPVVITPEMVGQTLAVFTAVEGKVGARKVTPEQAHFLDVVERAGGRAQVVRDDPTLVKP